MSNKASQQFPSEASFHKPLKFNMSNIPSSLFQAEKEEGVSIYVPKAHSTQSLFFLYLG